MGHVARSVGLIRDLLLRENEVFVACDAVQRRAFESYFPALTYIAHAGYPFAFSGKGTFGLDLFRNRRRLLARYGQEQGEVAQIVSDWQIDLVISDHRYGFFSKAVPSIFVTHQLHLPLRWYQWPAQWVHRKLLQHFGHVWCLDTADHHLAGKLSEPISHPDIAYIGPFSRFAPDTRGEIQYTHLFVVSGPEPYAETFFGEVLRFATGKEDAMACVVPKNYETGEIPANLTVYTAEDWQETDLLFYQSGWIVSRAGYSTLMDLEVLDKNAILIPTRGQAEQLYLGQLHQHSEKWIFRPGLETPGC